MNSETNIRILNTWFWGTVEPSHDWYLRNELSGGMGGVVQLTPKLWVSNIEKKHIELKRNERAFVELEFS